MYQGRASHCLSLALFRCENRFLPASAPRGSSTGEAGGQNLEEHHLLWPDSHGCGSVTSYCSDRPALRKGELQRGSWLARSHGAGVGAVASPVVALAQLLEPRVWSRALWGGLLPWQSHATLLPVFVWAGGRQHGLPVLAGNSIYFFSSARALSRCIV